LTFSGNQRIRLWLVLLFTGLIRLLTLGAYPLFDATEARYAEIARKMAETANWITPQIDYGVPFWGKPPLSTWATALSLRVFGINEFAARFSSLLFGLGMVWLTYRLASRRLNRDYAVTAAAVLSTSALFFVASGSVMTDPALAFGTTLAMVAFWLAAKGDESPDRLWGYLFFVGLAIGLLAKGPVAVVLTLLPVALWAVWKRQWTCLWQRLPWLTGSLLTMAIALPWYMAAERATPGFLKYFIIGEHWKRFTESGWKGDLYGTGHSHPHGTIWLYWFLATFPWCFVFIGALLRRGRRAVELLRSDWIAYLVLWTAAPMLFFTLAGNILWTYVLPGVPAFALLLAELTGTAGDAAHLLKNHWLNRSLPLVTPVVFALSLVFLPPRIVMKKSQKGIVAGYRAARQTPASNLVYLGSKPNSAEFYSHGTAQVARDAQMLESSLNDRQRNFFAIKTNDLARIPEGITAHLMKIGDYGEYQLLVTAR